MPVPKFEIQANPNLASNEPSSTRPYCVDLQQTPPDKSLLEGADIRSLLTSKMLPWRRFGDRMIIAVEDAGSPHPAVHLPSGSTKHSTVRAQPGQITQFLQSEFKTDLLAKARDLCPDDLSCRNFKITGRPAIFAGLAIIMLATIVIFPQILLHTLFAWVFLATTATTVLRVFALLSWRRDNALPYWLPEGSTRISTHRRKLHVSVLVPLFRETHILPKLLESLENLEYPRENFEVFLLLEEVDTDTKDAVDSLTLPNFIQTIVVPRDWLQTKPKAMNYALPFCSGDIVGIYDAEDRPDPDQILKIVDHFLAAPANVACLQGYLDFYNSKSNWIARCFAIEYATWFRVLLKGIQNIGLPIPLGGTTVFFRRNILEEIGGWDAHNVTEDADLGMRLARRGYRCEMVNTTTWEEANNRPMAWVRQRSRWLKGFAITWLSHMHDPTRLRKDLGLAGYISFHIVLLGGLSAFLAAPIFWALWIFTLVSSGAPIEIFHPLIWWSFVAIAVIGQMVMLMAMLFAISHTHLRHLFPYILALPFYWPLGALASYKAIWELLVAPFYWDKTEHGHDLDS